MIPDAARDRLSTGDLDWENDDIRCLFTKSAVLDDPSVATVAGMLAVVDEIADASYDRVSVTGRAVTEDNILHVIGWSADVLALPDVEGEEIVRQYAFYQHVGTDDVNLLVAVLTLPDSGYQLPSGPATVLFPPDDTHDVYVWLENAA